MSDTYCIDTRRMAMGDNEKATITAQYCLECERLALLAYLRSAIQMARKNGNTDMANKYCADIQFHQRQQYQHTCEGAGADHE